MAEVTFSKIRWTPAATMASNERQPLLRNRTEEGRSGVSQIRAHEVTSSAQDNPDYPVDHGYIAWMQVIGGFIIFANSW
jgi:hypothetical protein